MAKSTTIAVAWAKLDRWLPYIFVSAYAAFELVGYVAPDLVESIGPQGANFLLAMGLLLFFRSLDEKLRSRRGLQSGLTRDVSHSLMRDQKTVDVMLIAGWDGAKYLEILTDEGVRVENLRLLLTDLSLEPKWRRLVERKLVGQVEIRQREARPAWHCMVAPSLGAVFGSLASQSDDSVALEVDPCLIVPTNAEEHVLLSGVQQIFESAWNASVPRVSEK
jgi:hypothetical protein